MADENDTDTILDGEERQVAELVSETALDDHPTPRPAEPKPAISLESVTIATAHEPPQFDWYGVMERSHPGVIYVRAWSSDDAITRFDVAQGIIAHNPSHELFVLRSPDHQPSATDLERDEIIAAKLGPPTSP